MVRTREKLYNGHYFDLGAQELVSVDGTRTRLRPTTQKVFLELASSEGQVVMKQTLMETVWQDRFVSECTLSKSICEIRKALNDCRKASLKTINRVGFSLIRDDQTPVAYCVRKKLENPELFSCANFDVTARIQQKVSISFTEVNGTRSNYSYQGM